MEVRKISVLLFTLLLMTGCNKSNLNQNDQIHIAVSAYNLNDIFITELTQYIKQSAREEEGRSGTKIIIDIYDAQSLQIKQKNQMDDFIKRKYDVICMNLVDRTVASTMIDKAEKAEIPLIFFNREPVKSDIELWDKVYYVGSQSANTGYLEGMIVKDMYDADPAYIDKNQDHIIQYVLMEGEQGHQDALIRSETCLYPFTEDKIALEYLDSAIANWRRSEGKEQMKNFLDTYGDMIEVVFSNNDEMALGVLEEIEERGANIKVVGIDGTMAALQAVKNGKLLGTVLNDSKKQGENIFQLAYRLTKGISTDDLIESDDHRLYTPSIAITSDNVDEMIRQKEKEME